MRHRLKNTLHKIFLIILSGLLVSCGGGSGKDNNTTGRVENDVTISDFRVTDTLREYKIKIAGEEYLWSYGHFYDKDGNKLGRGSRPGYHHYGYYAIFGTIPLGENEYVAFYTLYDVPEDYSDRNVNRVDRSPSSGSWQWTDVLFGLSYTQNGKLKDKWPRGTITYDADTGVWRAEVDELVLTGAFDGDKVKGEASFRGMKGTFEGYDTAKNFTYGGFSGTDGSDVFSGGWESYSPAKREDLTGD